jgi:hypothetical protein
MESIQFKVYGESTGCARSRRRYLEYAMQISKTINTDARAMEAPSQGDQVQQTPQPV